ncbi:excisionase [Mycolicibacter virginiensis]|uniref:Excisionase n=1 Tax=Mycolicibacter virginiensis TaxID=1795032 RepID=A0A9X7P056_9MYCO|nr:helix-turn-helix domain-containing protein [Mycolicibacter virginiensis]PQM53752.1 excisionase [Mycolicibacter virginiensis]
MTLGRRPEPPPESEKVLDRGRALSTADVATMTGHGQRMVQRWVANGELPAVVLGRRRIRVFEADLNEFLDARFTVYGAMKDGAA